MTQKEIMFDLVTNEINHLTLKQLDQVWHFIIIDMNKEKENKKKKVTKKEKRLWNIWN